MDTVFKHCQSFDPNKDTDMESHIKNLFQHGINHYDRKKRQLGSNTLGCTVFAQRYSPRKNGFFGIEVSPKFFELWNDIGRPELVTYSRIEEDDKGNPVQVVRKNTSTLGYQHIEQGLCLVFQSEEHREGGLARLVEAYNLKDENLLATGEVVEEIIGQELMNEFLGMENISTIDELGRPLSPIATEVLFFKVTPSTIEGKGLYWIAYSTTAGNKTQVSTAPEQEPAAEETNF